MIHNSALPPCPISPSKGKPQRTWSDGTQSQFWRSRGGSEPLGSSVTSLVFKILVEMPSQTGCLLNPLRPFAEEPQYRCPSHPDTHTHTHTRPLTGSGQQMTSPVVGGKRHFLSGRKFLACKGGSKRYHFCRVCCLALCYNWRPLSVIGPVLILLCFLSLCRCCPVFGSGNPKFTICPCRHPEMALSLPLHPEKENVVENPPSQDNVHKSVLQLFGVCVWGRVPDFGVAKFPKHASNVTLHARHPHYFLPGTFPLPRSLPYRSSHPWPLLAPSP